MQIYQQCSLSYLAGGKGMVCTGIAAIEVQAALQIHAVPPKRWRRIARGVHLMGQVTAMTINQKKT